MPRPKHLPFKSLDRRNLTPAEWDEVVRRMRYGLFLLGRIKPLDLDRDTRYDCVLDAVIDAVRYPKPGVSFGRRLNWTLPRRVARARAKARSRRRAFSAGGVVENAASRELGPLWGLLFDEALDSARSKVTWTPRWHRVPCRWSVTVAGRSYDFAEGVWPTAWPKRDGIPVRVWEAMDRLVLGLYERGEVVVGGDWG